MRTLPGLLLLLSVLQATGQVEESIGQKILRKVVKTCGQPKINNVMRNLTLNPGETARFRCSVDMKCMVSYIQWYHEMNNGSMRLLRTGATQGNPYGYTVRRVNPNDAGFYSCVAGNILGETVSSAYLEINSSPPQAHVPSLAATLLLGLTLAQTHITNRYLLLMLVVHAMTLEHIAGIDPLLSPLSQVLFPGVAE